MRCENCGMNLPEEQVVCPVCGGKAVPDATAPVSPAAPDTQASPIPPVPAAKKPENFVNGIVGALLGAVLGGASIVLLNQLGYIAAISGLILAVCTLKGYELLGNQLSKKGIIICLILMLVTPYLADRISWAIIIVQQIDGVDFATAFQAVHLVIADADLIGAYVKDLVMVYLFCILGAFSTLRGLIKKS